jgi:hypothetical protein
VVSQHAARANRIVKGDYAVARHLLAASELGIMMGGVLAALHVIEPSRGDCAAQARRDADAGGLPYPTL